MRNYKIVLFAVLGFILGASPTLLQAQVADSIPIEAPEVIPELPGDEVEVVKDFHAQLAETQRIKILAELPVYPSTTLQYFYDVNIRGLSLDYPPPVIRPISLPIDPKEKSYQSSIALAYGYPHFSLANFDGLYKVGDRLDVGVHYDHSAARHDAKLPSRYYEHVGQIFASLNLFDFTSLKLGFDLDLDAHELVSRSSADAILRKTNSYGGFASIQQPRTKDYSWSYGAKIGFDNIAIADLDESESVFDLDLKTAKRFGVLAIGAGFDYDFVAFTGDTLDALNSIKFSPYFSYNDGPWNIKAGLQILAERGEQYYLPQVKLSREILSSKLQLSLFVDSDTRVNSWHNTLDFNPYISSISEITNEKVTRYGMGFTGIVDRLSYSAELGFKQINDQLAYYVNDQDSTSASILWDAKPVDAQSLYFATDVSFKVNDLVELKLNTQYQNLRDTLDLDVAGLYDLALDVGLVLSLLDNKLMIEPSVAWLENIAREGEFDHNGLVQVSLETDYRIQKNVGLFLNVYNLTNNQNERWTDYPAIGISLAGGVKARF